MSQERSTSASQHQPLTAKSRRIKEIRRLLRRRERTERGLFLAEGAKALTEALQVPSCVVEVFASATPSALAPGVRERAEAAGVPWTVVGDDAIAALSGTVTPQGVIALCRTVDVPLEQALADAEVVVVCADVRDPGNAGTIIRTADAAGADAVVLAGSSVDPYNHKTVRSTVGSLFHLPLALDADALGLVADLRSRGYAVLAADGAGERDLYAAADLLGGRVAWLFGNEAWGLPDELAAAADHRVAIPIHGAAESLNLATAAAVCLYETARVRRA